MAPTGAETATVSPLPDDATRLFEDARTMYAAALERLAADDIRDAAEKAWCATKRAADGLIVARTRSVPQQWPDTTSGLQLLSSEDEEVHQLVMSHYYAAREVLHGHCFYLGLCTPLSVPARLIRETADFIDEAERLAAG